ncbi:MAG TPA: tetratricopeptide repeat protein, partial [Phycisphaeraceae bacterium]
MTERASQSARRPAAEPSWSQVWHLPMLLLGAAIFVLGLFLAWPQHEPLDFDVMLKDAAVLLAAHNLDEAQQQLQKVQTYLEEYPQQADPEHQARFWELMGDLTYLQQHAQDVPGVLTEAGRSNYQKVVGYYHQAQEIGQGIDRPLNQQSMQWLSRALVRLGQDEAALAVVDQLKTVRDRYMVIRDLIEHRRRNNPTGDPTRLVPLLERFKTQIDQELNEQARLKQQLWLVQVQARLHLDADDPQWAIDHLLLWLQRLQGQATVQEMAPLYVLLAQAYQQEGDLEEARRYYLFAQQQIDRTNGLTADILVGLGRIALAGSSEQGVHEAIALLSEAVKNYPSEPAYVDALIGLADCQARVEDFAGATEHFRLAVAELVESAPAWDARRQRLVEVVRSHIQRCADQQLHEQALQMLTLLLPLYGKDLPPPLLLDFAATHEQIAQKRRAQAQQMATQEAADAQQGGRATTAPPTVEAQRLANQEAAIHFTQAAQYYLRHARAVTIADDAAHGESLWRAAVNFDRAQRWKDAITVYAEFIETRRSDPLHLRAIHQLGKAYLADGQPQPAADLFLQLVENHPNTPETYESLV